MREKFTGAGSKGGADLSPESGTTCGKLKSWEAYLEKREGERKEQREIEGERERRRKKDRKKETEYPGFLLKLGNRNKKTGKVWVSTNRPKRDFNF